MPSLYPVDILVASEGPALAGHLVGMLLEPCAEDLGAAVMEALAAFELGRSEHASQAAMPPPIGTTGSGHPYPCRRRGGLANPPSSGERYRRLSSNVAHWSCPVIRSRTGGLCEHCSTKAAEPRFRRSERTPAICGCCEEVQIEAVCRRLAPERMLSRCQNSGRCLALVEDQFAATTRPNMGVTVMTIHKAKGEGIRRSHRFREPVSAVPTARRR
ncbi:MAG: hypothetical protein IPO66_20500 [Rhodanobacteraceae bacterium]|nr:hypothetical protein [Rhodanobacteraceae bacterium]